MYLFPWAHQDTPSSRMGQTFLFFSSFRKHLTYWIKIEFQSRILALEEECYICSKQMFHCRFFFVDGIFQDKLQHISSLWSDQHNASLFSLYQILPEHIQQVLDFKFIETHPPIAVHLIGFHKLEISLSLFARIFLAFCYNTFFFFLHFFCFICLQMFLLQEYFELPFFLNSILFLLSLKSRRFRMSHFNGLCASWFSAVWIGSISFLFRHRYINHGNMPVFFLIWYLMHSRRSSPGHVWFSV